MVDVKPAGRVHQPLGPRQFQEDPEVVPVEVRDELLPVDASRRFVGFVPMGLRRRSDARGKPWRSSIFVVRFCKITSIS
jgi:hypothetical protein